MTKDIYHRVGKYLHDIGFENSNPLEQYNLLRSALYSYCAQKITELGLKIDTSKYNAYNLEGLFIQLHCCGIKDKNAFFDNFTHYILSVVGALQHFTIVWSISADAEGMPIVTFNNSGKWNELVSYNDTPAITNIIVALRTYENMLPLFEKSKEPISLNYEIK